MLALSEAGEASRVEVAHRLLPKKQPPLPQGRPLRDIAPYYIRSVDRRKEFVLGPKPGVLKGLGSVDKKVWKQYQTHLSRTTSLERAEFYAREMKELRMRSFRALSLLLGEPVNRVGRYIKLLELPEPIKAFLRQHRDGIPNDTDPDDDNDGIPDLQDPDRDGDTVTNLAEHAAGADPNDQNSPGGPGGGPAATSTGDNPNGDAWINDRCSGGSIGAGRRGLPWQLALLTMSTLFLLAAARSRR